MPGSPPRHPQYVGDYSMNPHFQREDDPSANQPMIGPQLPNASSPAVPPLPQISSAEEGSSAPDGFWACPQCTVHNQNDLSICSMCYYERK